MSCRNAIIRPFGLAIILFLGIAVAWIAVLTWCIEMTRNRFVTDVDDIERAYVILCDGTPVLRSMNRRNYEDTAYESLDGKKMEIPKNQPILQGAGLAGPRNEAASADPWISEERIVSIYANRKAAYWYFVSEGKAKDSGYFVGFDQKTNRCLGYIGLRGSSDTRPAPVDYFPVDRQRTQNNPGYRYVSRNNGLFLDCPYSDHDAFADIGYYPEWSQTRILLVSGDRLYKIDLEKRTVETFLKAPDMVAMNTAMVGSALPGRKDGDPLTFRLLIALRTADKIRAFDGQGKQIEEFAIPESLRSTPFCFYDLGAEKAILRSAFGTDSEKLQWIDTAGKIVREETIPSLNQRVSSFGPAECWEAAGGCPVLLGQALLYGIRPIDEDNDGEDYHYWSDLKKCLAVGWLPILMVVFLSASLAYFCFRRQRRFALPHTGLWVAFVFLCGVPGFLAYRFHRRWAVLEECPACKKKVPRDREACSACGKSFPPPELKGIEVFA
jgi:hypothetical protein